MGPGTARLPALFIGHIAGVRLGQAAFGHEKLYPQVLYADWIAAPHKMWLMYAVLIVAWVHGCIGLHFWLRMKGFYKRAAPFLLAGAVLVPTLAMLGLYQGVSMMERGAGHVANDIDRIFLYRRPILDYWCESDEDLPHIVRHVLIHEIGHHFGLSDDDMEAIEAKAEEESQRAQPNA